MKNLSILVPFQDKHITGILEGTTDVPEDVYQLVEELCEEHENEDWVFFLVRWLIIQEENQY